MDELKDKITDEELENVTGGSILRKSISYCCQKCGVCCRAFQIDEYASKNSNGYTHKSCGGLMEIRTS